MWRWEKENRHLFKEWWCLINTVESVVSRDNLQRYHYNHLWSKEFEKSNLIFVEPTQYKDINDNFRALLKDLLVESSRGQAAPGVRMENAKAKLKVFERVMQKVELRSLPTNSTRLFHQICDEILPQPYSAFWVFKLTDNSIAGFYAKVTSSDSTVRNMLTEGISLDHKQTAFKLDLLKKLWRMCQPTS